MTTKCCSKCNIFKELYCYSKDKQKKDGLRSNCKECGRIYNKKIAIKQKEQRHNNLKLVSLQNEEWKTINGFENYKISNLGRVYSKPRKGGGGFCKTYINGTGYYTVALTKDSKTIQKTIHRLVAKHFLINENPDEYDIVDHIDRNRLNNNITNLRWVNCKINSMNRTVNGSIYVNKRKCKNKEYIYYRVKIGNNNYGSYKTKKEAEEILREKKQEYTNHIKMNIDNIIITT